MSLGAILAHIAGYFGEWIDWFIGRIVDVWLSFPPVILSLILMVGLGTGLQNVILAIVLVDWTRFCRVLRSEVLVVTRRDYVAAARLLGFSHWRTVTREIVPATLPLLITLMSLEMGVAVIVEAILSFVGMSVGSEVPAWGQMIADARQNIYHAPWNLICPILAIFYHSVRLQRSGRRPSQDARYPPESDGARMTTSLLTARNLSVGATTRSGILSGHFGSELRSAAGKDSRTRRQVRCWKVDDRAHHRPVSPIRILRQQR